MSPPLSVCYLGVRAVMAALAQSPDGSEVQAGPASQSVRCPIKLFEFGNLYLYIYLFGAQSIVNPLKPNWTVEPTGCRSESCWDERLWGCASRCVPGRGRCCETGINKEIGLFRAMQMLFFVWSWSDYGVHLIAVCVCVCVCVCACVS